ncbi:MAG: hypothetical protein ACREQA_19760 [Candidatus Binatia bacterium]
MAKQTGMGDNFYVDGVDLSGDINSFSRIGGGINTQDVTGINKEAIERLGLLRDGGMAFVAYFNDATGQAHLNLRTLPTTDRIMTYCRSTTLGKPAASLNAKQLNYDGNRNNDGSLLFNSEGQANTFGLEWGEQLTAGKRTDSAATNGTGVDFSASSLFGLQAYLHVFAFTGTSATIKLQESSDDAAVDPYADVTGGGFTTVTASTKERIETSRTLTVERWLRVVTTGTFSNLVFAVMVVKNTTSVVF